MYLGNGKVLETVQALMEFHGAGLERLMKIVAEAGDAGYAVFDNFARDDLVGSLLLLYGLHPLPLETRVTKALDKVRPYLDSHGGNVELLGIADGVDRLRMQGSCKSCPSSAMTLKLAIEEGIYAAAPDVVAIEAEGVAEQPSATGFVQIGKSPGNGTNGNDTLSGKSLAGRRWRSQPPR
ncbi:MAG: NifU family protein [Pyrinomonadaceae bacterium]